MLKEVIKCNPEDYIYGLLTVIHHMYKKGLSFWLLFLPPQRSFITTKSLPDHILSFKGKYECFAIVIDIFLNTYLLR